MNKKTLLIDVSPSSILFLSLTVKENSSKQFTYMSDEDATLHRFELDVLIHYISISSIWFIMRLDRLIIQFQQRNRMLVYQRLIESLAGRN